MARTEVRSEADLHNGFSDKLQPVQSLDLGKVRSVNDLVKGMSKTAFGARNLGEAADVLEAMAKDKDCFKVLTLSGAMTVAKMGLVVCDMIDNGMVDAVISTGALMAHGLVEAAGMTHFKHDPAMSDEQLYEMGYNRVYDTLELEKNLDDTWNLLDKILSKVESDAVLSSHELHRIIGGYLAENTPSESRAILKSAYANNVPVYVPAFTDSELALDFDIYNRLAESNGKKPIAFNAFKDLRDYSKRVADAKKIGIFTVGGGVPRNWAQQVAPYLEAVERRYPSLLKRGSAKKFFYAVRICPEPAFWGGLSGCTYSESVSWGKLVSRKEGGMQAEVFADATIAWPLIVKAVLERMGKA
ncbi:MAG: deoxyhypusine synthase family protein [Candidatus Micrarchaeota archaeon]